MVPDAGAGAPAHREAARSVRGRRGGAAGHRGVPRRRPQAARRAVRAAGGARAARCCSTRARLPSRMPHVGNVLRGHQARKLLPLGGGGRRAGRRGAVGRRAGGGGGSGEQHTRRGAYERRVRGCGRGRTAGGRLWQLSADGARRAAAPALRHTGLYGTRGVPVQLWPQVRSVEPGRDAVLAVLRTHAFLGWRRRPCGGSYGAT
mmetsp:Transcript_5705/g.17404  ORF Transcript_5705/g.17404 Transcript_5705/m.17404 type:complete len:204 (+) Transcript_5705:1551-2162(+)